MLFLILFAIPVFCHADVENKASGLDDTGDPSGLFDQAHNAYIDGRYPDAISLFEKIGSDFGVSASLLHNLGNSYAQNGQLGKAILNYERALLLSLCNYDIVTNLNLLRDKVGDLDIGKKGLVIRVLSKYLVLYHWIVLGLIGGAGLLSVYMVSILTSSKRIIRLTAVVCSVLVISASGMGWYVNHRDYRSAVVVEKSADLQISPFSGSELRTMIAEGHLVTASQYHAGYYLVEKRNGDNGWLPETSIEFIAPWPNKK